MDRQRDLFDERGGAGTRLTPAASARPASPVPASLGDDDLVGRLADAGPSDIDALCDEIAARSLAVAVPALERVWRRFHGFGVDRPLREQCAVLETLARLDPAAVIARLDQTRAKYADLVLVHGGGPGVEKIAASWAERNGVHQIVCKPDWDRHGRAAPFRRNEELLNLLPKGVIAFPGGGITENLVDRARQMGIPVLKAAA